MNPIIIKIIPVLLIFVIGFFLHRWGLFKKEDGDLFLKLAFYVSIPALVILAITSIDITIDFIVLPITAVLILGITYFISFFVGKKLGLSKQAFGVFLVATMIMNIGFSLPFFIAAYGAEGLARAALFNFGNSFITFTFVYYLACKYGKHTSNNKTLMKKFLSSPPLWALILAIALNLASVALPDMATTFLGYIGAMTIPLVMLALGIHFRPTFYKLKPVLAAILIRFGIGLALGFFFVWLFHLEGLMRIIVLIGASAPFGYNTLTYASLENLDKNFAASLISIGILIGIFFIPLLIFLL